METRDAVNNRPQFTKLKKETRAIVSSVAHSSLTTGLSAHEELGHATLNMGSATMCASVALAKCCRAKQTKRSSSKPRPRCTVRTPMLLATTLGPAIAAALERTCMRWLDFHASPVNLGVTTAPAPRPHDTDAHAPRDAARFKSKPHLQGTPNANDVQRGATRVYFSTARIMPQIREHACVGWIFMRGIWLADGGSRPRTACSP
jgi:hypothetical protein